MSANVLSDATLGREMYDRAVAFLDCRFPTGWGGCAVMYTAEGRFLTGVFLESANAAAGLCMETGAMCEAQKYNLNITHSLCLSREDEHTSPTILTACGICQERLRYWGDGVKVAVSNPENKILFKTLHELSSFHWADTIPADEREHYEPGLCLDE